MIRSTLLIALLFFVGLVQIQAQQADEFEDDIASELEGSGYDVDKIPSDDEDIRGEDFSGSGDYDDTSYSDDEDDLISSVSPATKKESKNKNVRKGDREEIDVVVLNENPDVNPGEPVKKPTPDPAASFVNSTAFMAALIIGGVVGLLLAFCVLLLVLYRVKKKDEGSYSIDVDKKPSANYQYTQGQEYFA